MALRINLHPHALDQAAIRGGASEKEIVATVAHGEMFAAKYGRTGFRRNFTFDGIWRGRRMLRNKSKHLPLRKMALGWL